MGDSWQANSAGEKAMVRYSRLIAIIGLVALVVLPPNLALFGASAQSGVAFAQAYKDGAPTGAPLVACGTAEFFPYTTLNVDVQPFGVTPSDLNHDGSSDLVNANFQVGTITVLLGNGSGGFAPATSIPVGAYPEQVAIADLNRDGNPDLAAARSDYYTGNITVLLGNGSGGFGAPTGFAVGSEPVDVAVAD